MRNLVLAALFATVAAAPALAQGPAEAPFTGPRVEGLVGWDHAKGAGGKDSGVAYGLGAGYDVQMGRAVVGAEAEIADANTRQCATGVAAAGDRLCASAKRDLYVGGRIGTAVTPSTLLYAKAGYTNARYGVGYTGVAGGPANYSFRENLDGVRVGGGVEHKLGPNSYVKAEYRYSNYEQGFDRHQVLGGFGFRF